MDFLFLVVGVAFFYGALSIVGLCFGWLSKPRQSGPVATFLINTAYVALIIFLIPVVLFGFYIFGMCVKGIFVEGDTALRGIGGLFQ